MNRFALLAGVAAILVAGCAKSGRSLDGDWSMLVAGTDNGTQRMRFSGGKKWEFTANYESGSAKYTVTANGTYKLDAEQKMLTMTTEGGDSDMAGGTEEQKKRFPATREEYIKAMETAKGQEDTAPLTWLNDNSFETSFQGSKVTFHRK